MKKKAEVRSRIKKVMVNLGIDNQVKFAKRLGFQPTTVNAWLTGASLPSPDAYMALGREAPNVEDSLFFWECAGLTQNAILLAAAKIEGERIRDVSSEIAAGKAVLVPRFRETARGREEAGPPVSLPVEFVPHPRTTICLSVRARDTGIVDAPSGLFILDTSVEGAEHVDELWDRVVMIHYDYPAFATFFPKGIYAGRLIILMPTQLAAESPAVSVSAALLSLTRSEIYQRIFLGEYIEPDCLRGIQPEDQEARKRRMEEIEKRALSRLQLHHGIRILGKVIGRLTGHLERMPSGE
jgi:hypothetical protein